MRRTVSLREGTAQHRSFCFRPPDPVWASSTQLEEVRAGLAAFDPRVTLWWSSTHCCDDQVRPGRWRLVEWMPNHGNWSTICYWKGPQNQYREPGPLSAMTARLEKIARNMKELAAEVARDAERNEKKRKATLMTDLSEYNRDLFERQFGIKQTFGPGGIRSRAGIRRGLDRGVNTNQAQHLRRLGLQ